MAAASTRVVLHEAKTTYLWWVIPLFVVFGCLLVSVNITMPLLERPFAASGPGLWLSFGLALLAILAVPLGAALMFFFIPQIITTFEPKRRVIAQEFRRPLRRLVKEYRLDDLADIQPVYVRQNHYSLALRLKSGEDVRLDYVLLPNPTRLRQAEQIKAQLAPFFSVESSAS